MTPLERWQRIRECQLIIEGKGTCDGEFWDACREMVVELSNFEHRRQKTIRGLVFEEGGVQTGFPEGPSWGEVDRDRLDQLDKRERATNRLLNVLVGMVYKHVKLPKKQKDFLKQETRAFHEARYGLDVTALDKFYKKET
jgi:hypothetical protein